MAYSAARRTKYPQIYARVNGAGETTGFQVKPRFKGYFGPASKTFERLTDARAWLEEQRAAARHGKTKGSAQKTLAEAIEEYDRKEMLRLAATERRNRRRHLEWWKERLGCEWLRDLTRGDIMRELEVLAQVLPATRNRYKAALSAVLSAALEWEWIDSNPLHSASRRKRTKAERERERHRDITPEEWERLLPAFRASRDPRLYGLVICACASGARQGDLMAMEWTRLELHPKVKDPETGKTVPGVPRCTVPFGKNGEERVIYFEEEAGEILREMASRRGMSPYVWDLPGTPLRRCEGAGAPAAHGAPAGCEVCFATFQEHSGKVPDHHPRPEFPTMAFRYAVETRARIKNLHFHDLRHEWAVKLLEDGVSDTAGMILGGWKTQAMFRRYAAHAFRRGMAKGK
jgi:integrase